jgi:hypothetical protein
MSHDEFLLMDDLLDEPEDPFSIPEIERELAHAHRDEELGLRALLEQPELALPQRRLARVPAKALYRMYAGNSSADGDVSSAA